MLAGSQQRRGALQSRQVAPALSSGLRPLDTPSPPELGSPEGLSVTPAAPYLCHQTQELAVRVPSREMGHVSPLYGAFQNLRGNAFDVTAQHRFVASQHC